MNKIALLKFCIYVNLIIMFMFGTSFYAFHKYNSQYFRVGWSESFIYVSIPIDTPFKYFLLCSFIVAMNVSEICMDSIATPLIQFSTYNPYKTQINDFSRMELEIYSNTIYLLQNLRRFITIFTILSQVDIALISLVSCQTTAGIIIKYLLDQKNFSSNESIELNYTNVQELYPIINI